MPKTPPPGMPPDWPASSEARWMKPFCKTLMFLLARYRAEGQDNLPDPPYIVTPNHQSYFDIPALNIVMPYGLVGFAARKYKGTWREPLFELSALIWITQFSADRDAIRAGQKVLEAGLPLGIAPEGTRSRTGGLIRGTSGAAYLATRTGVPVVPVGMWGTEKVLRRPRPRVRLRIGKPLIFPKGRAKGEELDRYTEQIMCAIAALLPAEYHGVYAGNPLIDKMAARVR